MFKEVNAITIPTSTGHLNFRRSRFQFRHVGLNPHLRHSFGLGSDWRYRLWDEPVYHYRVVALRRVFRRATLDRQRGVVSSYQWHWRWGWVLGKDEEVDRQLYLVFIKCCIDYWDLRTHVTGISSSPSKYTQVPSALWLTVWIYSEELRKVRQAILWYSEMPCVYGTLRITAVTIWHQVKSLLQRRLLMKSTADRHKNRCGSQSLLQTCAEVVSDPKFATSICQISEHPQ